MNQVSHLEEVLLLEAVGGAGLEVHLDVLPLLERRLHRVDLFHRTRRYGVDQSAILLPFESGIDKRRYKEEASL